MPSQIPQGKYYCSCRRCHGMQADVICGKNSSVLETAWSGVMIQGRGGCTFVRFLKPTVRMSKAVKAREAEFRISHVGAAIAPIAVATPASHSAS